MSALLEVSNLRAGYGDAIVIDDLSFAVQEGSNLALLGRNGVGKTTLLETLMGNTRISGGAIRVRGRDVTATTPFARARMHIGWVPQEREVFPSLTVAENLDVVARAGHWSRAAVFDLFPRLAERSHHYGNQLSGGEQQMLAIGRALMLNPKLLLLDEPMEGLAPIIVEELAVAIRNMSQQDGLTTIIVEQQPALALSMTSQAMVLERGRVVHYGASAELAASSRLLERFLGIGLADEFDVTAASGGFRSPELPSAE
jgi:branched-chain amino acid transport system ATP-binding protein